MSHHDHLHQRHARAAFSWPSPAAIISALAAPFEDKGNGDDNSNQQTVTHYVYKTASPTFDGSIAGYTTPGLPAAASSTPDVQSSPITSDQESATATAQPAATQASTSNGLPASILFSSTSIASTASLLAAPPTIQSSSSLSATALSAATSSSTAQASTDASSDGMTAGAKAGIAIAIVLAICAIASLIFFCIRQRRQAAQRQRLEDEKYEVDNDPFFGNRAASTRTAKTASTAPRLSLRPVTQFLPGFGDNRRNSRGNALDLNVATADFPMQSQALPYKSAWERPMTSESQSRQNPFGNHAETIDPVNAAGPSIVQGPSPGAEKIMEGAAVGAAAGATAGAAVGLARGASKRGFGPRPLDFTKTLPGVGPPSPAGTEFSHSEAPGTPMATSGAAAIAAAGGPQNTAVHRVQLDFKPSMDDELELRAGQLIRLLHEYDDGWALCIRLDRSQQGVVPRTCLSMRPVKPRPQQGPPRGNPPPGMRVPQQQQGRPMSPAMNGQRPASPAGNRPTTIWPQANPQVRPASPASNRPSTAGGPYGPPGGYMPQNGRSSPSPAQMQDRRNSPPGSSGPRTPYGSPPNGSSVGRKPVPGQAM